MRERPILFSAPMVRAILDGTKTQTRRLVKLPKWAMRDEAGAYEALRKHPTGIAWRGPCDGCTPRWTCPYGVPGDHLWVRETFVLESNYGFDSEESYPPPHSDGRPIQRHDDECNGPYWAQPHYRATDDDPELCDPHGDEEYAHTRWTPSIHMPRWASRLTLEVTDVRVQRLHEISTEDALAEGLEQTGQITSVDNFSLLWDRINAKRAPWDSNPWVWAITFRRLP